MKPLIRITIRSRCGAFGALIVALALTAACDGNGSNPVGPTPPSTAATNTLSMASLGLTLQYPATWFEGAVPETWSEGVTAESYASCVGCTILGPRSAPHPYGVQIFTEDLDPGCAVSCYVGNNAIGPGDTPLGPASQQSVRVTDIDSKRMEIRRQVPLGILNSTGDDTPYHEIWTLVPWYGKALFFVAFFRDGDSAAEAETRAAYDAMLGSVSRLPPPPAQRPASSSASRTVSTGQTISVWGYADAMPARDNCIDALPDMMPASAEVPGGKLITCTVDQAAAARLRFVSDEANVLHLSRVEVLLPATAAPPNGREGDCKDLRSILLPASADPRTAQVKLVCLVEPPARGTVSASRVAFWAYVLPHTSPTAASAPVGCWELARFIGAPAGADTVAVPCVLDSNDVPRAAAAAPAGLGRIVYALDGDLWVKELADGVAQRITNHGTYEAYARPKWSPSGGWLTFTTGKTIGVMRADGSDARLFVTAEQIAWSPVADRLAYTTLGAETAGGPMVGKLFVENADGSQKKAIARWSDASDSAFGWWQPAWSPDGASIAYVEQSGPTSPPPTYAAIWQVAADGSRPPTEVYSAPNPTQEGVGVIGWTPAGAILFCSLSWLPSDRYPEELAASDGVTLHEAWPGAGQVIDFAPMVPTMLLQPEPRSFAPAGDLMAITYGGGRETWTNKSIVVLSTVSAAGVSATDGGGAAIEPSWSPDARHIAYAAAPDASSAAATEGDRAALVAVTAPRKIWVMGTYSDGRYGANPRQLTSDPAYRDELPQWSADGSQILFARLQAPGQPDAQERWSFWIMPSSGGAAREVVLGIGSSDFAWRVGYDRQLDVRGLPAWFDWWRGPGAAGGAKPAD